MPLPTLPYKRPFFSVTLNPHEIEVRQRAAQFWFANERSKFRERHTGT